MRPIALTLLVFLMACSPAIAISPAPTLTMAPATQAVPLLTQTSVPPVAVGTASVSPTPENPARPHYLLHLTWDFAARVASVHEAIRYTNRTGGALQDLVLAVEPHLWPAAFLLTDLTVNGAPSSPDLSGERMTIKLAKPLADLETVELEIEYELHMPVENQRYLFGYDAHQTNLLDWYPFIVPYGPGGWILHKPAPAGEHLVYESADFDVYLRFTDVGATPIVAASAPGLPEEGWTHYHLSGARGFAFSASQRFLTSTTQAGDVPVTSYYFDGQQQAGAQAAKMAAQAVQLFSQKFSPYPYQSLSVVESASSDGMEADGLFFMAGSFYDSYNGTLENYLTTLSVHETAHQWWYGLVGNDQAAEPWLDEALATYSERIFYAANYPDELTWWWYFRIRRFEPVGAANADIYANGSFRTYTNASYFMGAYMLDDLRVRVGDPAFFAALADYATQNAHKIASAQSFFAALSRNTSTDYSDIVKQYFK